MHNKRITVRTVTGALNAGGVVFLVFGVFLSALSTPVLASAPVLANASMRAGSEPSREGSWPGSSTRRPTRTVTQTPTRRPTRTVTQTATERPTRTPTETQTQRPTRTVTLTPTERPSRTPRPTRTATATSTPPAVEITVTPEVTQTPPAPTGTSPAVVLNLSPVCGYPDDTTLTWAVNNPGGTQLTFTWQVAGSNESGSGTVPANSVVYFTTSRGEKVVNLLVNGAQVASANSLPACRVNLSPSYVCRNATTLNWFVFNGNGEVVSFQWTLDNAQTGSGTAGPNQRVRITTSGLGQHSLSVTWQIQPLGSRTVILNASVPSCGAVVTASPQATNTPPFVVITETPTRVVTASRTPSPTVSITPPVTATGATPTPSQTPPLAQITRTGTPSQTPIATVGPPVAQGTPPIIPVTGEDLLAPAETARLIARLFVNIGLFLLAVGLGLAAITRLWKK